VRIPIQKENEVPLGPEAKGEENGEEISPCSSDSEVWESVMSSPSWVRAELRPKMVLL